MAAQSDEILWDIEPHTQAKHEILRRYLNAWFPILDTAFPRVIYFDGFAGPGEYTAGEPGSPIIALDVAANHLRPMEGKVVFFFVDNNENAVENLQQLVGRLELPDNFYVRIHHEHFHNVLEAVLDRLDELNDDYAPIFAFVDPFGFSGVPMELIHRLLSRRSTEVFINFSVGFINRFLEHPNSEISKHMVELFGTEKVLETASGEGDRINLLRQLYQRQLSGSANFVRYFSMYDQRNRPIYDLFFAGNHSLGHYKMKVAMWKVDPDGQFQFSDATDPYQQILFTVDSTPQLLDTICQQFEQRTRVRVEEIRHWVRDNTAFIDKHMRKTLKLGEKEDRLHIHPNKVSGEKRRKGTFPNDVLIDFP